MVGYILNLSPSLPRIRCRIGLHSVHGNSLDLCKLQQFRFTVPQHMWLEIKPCSLGRIDPDDQPLAQEGLEPCRCLRFLCTQHVLLLSSRHTGRSSQLSKAFLRISPQSGVEYAECLNPMRLSLTYAFPDSTCKVAPSRRNTVQTPTCCACMQAFALRVLDAMRHSQPSTGSGTRLCLEDIVRDVPLPVGCCTSKPQVCLPPSYLAVVPGVAKVTKALR